MEEHSSYSSYSFFLSLLSSPPINAPSPPNERPFFNLSPPFAVPIVKLESDAAAAFHGEGCPVTPVVDGTRADDHAAKEVGTYY